jgi:hypothetical protein
MLGISIDDTGYWNETRGMAQELRNKLRKLIDEKYRGDNDMSGTLNKVLDDAEEATTLQNRVFHAVWMARGGLEPVLHDRDNTLRQHQDFRLPTAEEIRGLCDRIERIHRVLNHLTKQL